MPYLQAKHPHQGFTLIEILIVISLVAILASLAGPSFIQFSAKNRVKNISSDLHVTMLKARSEAVKRNANVRIIPNGGNWKSGWQVLDAANNDLFNIQDTHAQITTSFSGNIVYMSSGRVQNATNLAFTIDDASVTLNDNDKRCVRVNLTGMPVIKVGAC